jgi:hypothetical protein
MMRQAPHQIYNLSEPRFAPVHIFLCWFKQIHQKFKKIFHSNMFLCSKKLELVPHLLNSPQTPIPVSNYGESSPIVCAAKQKVSLK